jgi:hypothetical protein
VLQGLGAGAVGDPVLLELIQVLGAIQRDDRCGQAAGHPDGTVKAGHHWQGGGNRKLEQLEPLVARWLSPLLRSYQLDWSFGRSQVGSAAVGRVWPRSASGRSWSVPRGVPSALLLVGCGFLKAA